MIYFLKRFCLYILDFLVFGAIILGQVTAIMTFGPVSLVIGNACILSALFTFDDRRAL